MKRILLAFGAAALSAGNITAQQQAKSYVAPRNEFSVTIQPIGGSLSYARSIAPGRLIGLQVGIGGHFIEYMVLAGRHFSEDGGLHYEPRDNATNPLMFEILSASAFYRMEPSTRWQIDVGARASSFLHLDSSDDDPGGGYYLGSYASVMYGWKRVKFGPEILVGVFTEGTFQSRSEFGVHFAPLMGRLTVGW